MTCTLIALDTSSEYCSVALIHHDLLLTREVHSGQKHSEQLLPMMSDVLAKGDVVLEQCDAIAFAAGPGSFTGLRIACGVAQGLAYGINRPVIAVGTLCAMAEQLRLELNGMSHGTQVLSALDARMGEIYWSILVWQDGEWFEQVAPRLSCPENLAYELKTLKLHAHFGCGNAFTLFPGLMQNCVRRVLGPQQSLASWIAQLAVRSWRRGQAQSALQAAPIYVRNQVALTTCERQNKK